MSKIKFPKYPSPLWTFFTALFCLPSLIRTSILFEQTEFHPRILKTFSLGLGYDLMNAALIALVVGLLPLTNRLFKIISILLFFGLAVFSFVNYQYLLQFGSHLPFHTLEYLQSPQHFSSTVIAALLHPSFMLIVLFPITGFVFIAYHFQTYAQSWKRKLLIRISSLITLFVIGGSAGSYSNSYVGKNIDDPLTTAALNYFFWTQDREKKVAIRKPTEALELIQTDLLGKITTDPIYSEYPLVRKHDAKGCSVNATELAKLLCSDPFKKLNVILLLMESFRAAEIGVYGSKIDLTPRFDEWSKKGILFKNFYANGFQTRHGEISTYCSVMPNYGAAVLKRYAKNQFRCLPAVLQENGYSTIWIHAGDASFDGQATFFQENGFEKIIDKFDFPSDTEELGWGYSDGALFQKLLTTLPSLKNPFFASALTITNHHPFEVPTEYELGLGNQDLHNYYNSIHYMDSKLGEFLSLAEKEPWFENTLIIITADTSSFQPPQSEPKDFGEFVSLRSRIPLLILGGSIKQNAEINEFASQIDLAPTIMDLLGLSWTSPWVGKSLIGKQDLSIAYTNRPGSYWAVMSKEGNVFSENDNKFHVDDLIDLKLENKLKSLGSSWLRVTSWLLQEDLYWPKLDNNN
ncbi:MAG: sulfatase-like hydrolase/transferase [Deltaproteobacteria bacterium]|nr:sulfatase-like hydrolase/transferase [Deltaproteobacteria bacterium]